MLQTNFNFIIKLPNLMFATFLGNLPGAITYTVLGSFIGNLSGTEDFKVSPRVKYLTALLSLNLLVASVVYITMFSKRALRQAIHEPVPTSDDDEENQLASPDTHVAYPSNAESDREPLVSNSFADLISDGDSIHMELDVSDPNRRRSPRRSNTPLAVEEDVESGLGTPLDAHVVDGGYTAEEKRILTLTFWCCLTSLIIGIPIILLLTQSNA
jgi:hypothetical protein